MRRNSLLAALCDFFCGFGGPAVGYVCRKELVCVLGDGFQEAGGVGKSGAKRELCAWRTFAFAKQRRRRRSARLVAAVEMMVVAGEVVSGKERLK
ncbi:hypothetical protein Droror1_Dr00008236 [Drosera rotundifolia]